MVNRRTTNSRLSMDTSGAAPTKPSLPDKDAQAVLEFITLALSAPPEQLQKFLHQADTKHLN